MGGPGHAKLHVHVYCVCPRKQYLTCGTGLAYQVDLNGRLVFS